MQMEESKQNNSANQLEMAKQKQQYNYLVPQKKSKNINNDLQDIGSPRKSN